MTAPLCWPAAAPLATADLFLEPVRVEDAEEMAGALDDPRIHAYIGGQPATMEQLKERYRRLVVGRSVDGSQLWFNWVLRHRQTRKAIGFVQATGRRLDGVWVAELAWVIAPHYQGRGFARQATDAVVIWLRGFGVSRFIAHIHPDHRASMAVAAGIGMTATETVVDDEVRWIL